MIKKFGPAFGVFLFCLFLIPAMAAPVLMAQDAAVNSADVDLFIKLAYTKGAPGKQQLMRDSGRDVSSLASTQGKIGTVAAMIYSKMPDDQIKANMSSWGVSPAEFAAIVNRRDEVVAAFRASQGLR